MTVEGEAAKIKDAIQVEWNPVTNIAQVTTAFLCKRPPCLEESPSDEKPMSKVDGEAEIRKAIKVEWDPVTKIARVTTTFLCKRPPCLEE